MQSNQLFFSKAVIINDIKRYWLVSVGYLLMLIYLVPINIISINNRTYVDKEYLNSFLPKIGDIIYINDESIMIMVLIPVLVSILLFRYMQVKKSSDMIHSLPLTRNQIFNSNIIAGSLLLIIPIIITGLITMIILPSLEISKYLTFSGIIHWIITAVLLNMLLFITCCLIGVLTSISLIQGIFTYIFLLTPYVLAVFVIDNLSLIIKGLEYNPLGKIYNSLSPLLLFLNRGIANMYNKNNEILIRFQWTVGELVYIIILIIAFLLLAKYLYNKRKLETISQTITFKRLQPIVKYLFTLGCMLLVGMYFINKKVNVNIELITFLYIVIALIAYTIAVMFINKSFSINIKQYKGFSLYSGIILIIILGVKFDVIGYEKRIPSIQDIEWVSMNEHPEYYEDKNIYEDIYFEKDGKEYLSQAYYSKETIKNIIKLHKEIIKKPIIQTKNNTQENQKVYIHYKYKNGKNMFRCYYIDEKEYNQLFIPIFETKEYKMNDLEIRKFKKSDILKLEIYSQLDDLKSITIDNPEEIKEIKSIIEEEVLNISYDDYYDSNILNNYRIKAILANENLDSDENCLSIKFVEKYSKIRTWLEDHGYMDKLLVAIEDIDHITVQNYNNGKKLEIDKKEQIKECLDTMTGIDIDGYRRLNVEITLKNNSVNDVGYTFEANTIPQFIKNYFGE